MSRIYILIQIRAIYLQDVQSGIDHLPSPFLGAFIPSIYITAFQLPPSPYIQSSIDTLTLYIQHAPRYQFLNLQDFLILLHQNLLQTRTLPLIPLDLILTRPQFPQ